MSFSDNYPCIKHLERQIDLIGPSSVHFQDWKTVSKIIHVQIQFMEKNAWKEYFLGKQSVSTKSKGTTA